MAKKSTRKTPTTYDKAIEAELLAAAKRASIFASDEDEDLDREALQERLDEASQLYAQGGKRSRDGMRLALSSTISFLRAELDAVAGEIDRLLHPLDQLVLALSALDEGMVHSSLACAKRAGGTKLTKDEAEFRLLICFCVTLLIKKGRSSDAACEYVRDKLRHRGFFRSRRTTSGTAQPIDTKTIKGWHSSSRPLIEKVVSNRRIRFETWFLRKAMSPFGLLPMQLTSHPDGVVDHVLQHVLPVCYGHLRGERK